MNSRSFLFLALVFLVLTPLAECNQTALKADKVIVKKSERKLVLLKQDKILKEYTIALGFEPKGHKTQEGDGKTPEGVYKIDSRNPHSQFHRSLHITYPNQEDRKAASAQCVSPGCEIRIHGLGKGFGFVGAAHTLRDWTLGCIAVTNEEIEEIWEAVPNGTPIEILP